MLPSLATGLMRRVSLGPSCWMARYHLHCRHTRRRAECGPVLASLRKYIAPTHLPGPASRGPRTLSGLVPDSLAHAGMAIFRGHHLAAALPAESTGLVY